MGAVGALGSLLLLVSFDPVGQSVAKTGVQNNWTPVPQRRGRTRLHCGSARNRVIDDEHHDRADDRHEQAIDV